MSYRNIEIKKKYEKPGREAREVETVGRGQLLIVQLLVYLTSLLSKGTHFRSTSENFNVDTKNNNIIIIHPSHNFMWLSPLLMCYTYTCTPDFTALVMTVFTLDHTLANRNSLLFPGSYSHTLVFPWVWHLFTVLLC